MEEIRELSINYFKKFLKEEQASNLEEQLFKNNNEEFAYKQAVRLYLNALERKTWEYSDSLPTAFQLDKKQWQSFQIAEETMDTMVATQLKPAATSMYTCGKCKKSECTFYTRQTRGGDESETIFITCLNCKHKWKQ